MNSLTLSLSSVNEISLQRCGICATDALKVLMHGVRIARYRKRLAQERHKLVIHYFVTV